MRSFAARLAAISLIGAALPAAAQTAQFRTILQFAPFEGRVVRPLVFSGGTLAGMMEGSGCCGAIFAAAPGYPGYKIVHQFATVADGFSPSSLTITAGGFIYGTAAGGGTGLRGTIFRLTGGFANLHSFAGGAEGASPQGAMVEGTDGMLYGTTSVGGADADGLGSIFRFDPASGALTTLYTFTGGADGATPLGDLVRDSAGQLLGTTSQGGNLVACYQGCGTIFRFDPSAGHLTTLHRFADSDGAIPAAGLTPGPGGVFYGSTTRRGNAGGTIFALTSAGLTTLRAFPLHQHTGGISGKLVLAPNGSLYGTAPDGGPFGEGVVFRLNPATRDYRILHAFKGEPDGGFPIAGLTLGPDGLLYGATSYYGTSTLGTLFRLRP